LLAGLHCSRFNIAQEIGRDIPVERDPVKGKMQVVQRH
jgi:hypothetical protein